MTTSNSGQTTTRDANTPAPAKKKTEYPDWLLIVFSLIAFAAAAYLFTGHRPGNRVQYFDWQINVRGSCLNLLDTEKRGLEDSLAVLKERQDSLPKEQRKQLLPVLLKKQDSISKKMQLITDETFRIRTLWDTSSSIVPDAAFQKNILLERDDIRLLPKDPRKGSIRFYYKVPDTAKKAKLFLLSGKLQPTEEPDAPSVMEFFKRYPTTAFWAILTIAQFVFWVMIGSVARVLLANLWDSLLERNVGIKSKNGIIIVSIVAVAAFVLTFFLLIYDDRLWFDTWFMRGFNWKMMIYGVVGYTCATLLLYCFLITATLLVKAKKKYIGRMKKLQRAQTALAILIEKKNNLEKTGAALPADEAARLARLESVSTPDDKRLLDFKEDYNICRQHFNFFFAMAAIVLSVLVIWIGTMFAAVNNLELFAFTRTYTGRNLVPYDFVYLYGALHSLLLLIFYVPVRLRLLSVSFMIGDKLEMPEAKDVKGAFSSFLSRLAEIIAATSPLLAALLQSLFE